MARHRIPTGILALSLAAAAAAAASGRSTADAAIPARTEAEIRELDLAFYRQRVERDPHGASDRMQLALRYLERARETGEPADLGRAEALARASLGIRRGRNGAAYAVLASALMAQHRFVEALDAATRLLDLDSTSAAARATVAEIELELGRYDDAGRNFGMLAGRRTDLAVAPRLARWEELRDRPETARALLRDGRERLRRTHGASRQQLAWYQLRLGDLALRHGRLDEAAEELAAGLVIAPDDYRLLAARARLALARGDAAGALALGGRVLGRTLEPGTLGTMHDAALLQGDTTRAAEYARALAAAASAQPGPLHRTWSTFLLDHGRDVEGTLHRLREELRERRDVYGWDAYAWALYRAGRPREAAEASVRALSLGTRDAGLRFHAGMIARAIGDTAGARRHLGAALEINPFWHPSQPGEARAALDSLRGDTPR